MTTEAALQASKQAEEDEKKAMQAAIEARLRVAERYQRDALAGLHKSGGSTDDLPALPPAPAPTESEARFVREMSATSESSQSLATQLQESVYTPKAGSGASSGRGTPPAGVGDTIKEVSGPYVPQSIIKSLVNFASYSKFKRAALNTIAFTLNSEEIRGLRDAFQQIDTAGEGLLTAEEITTVLVEQGGMSHAEAQRIFDGLHHSKQTISYTEFLAAALGSSIRIEDSRMQEAFRRLDVDGCGYINADDLREVLGGDYTDDEVSQMVEEVGTVKEDDGNIAIDYNAFRRAVLEDKTKDVAALMGPEDGGLEESAGSAEGGQGGALPPAAVRRDTAGGEVAAVRQQHATDLRTASGRAIDGTTAAGGAGAGGGEVPPRLIRLGSEGGPSSVEPSVAALGLGFAESEARRVSIPGAVE